MLDVGNVRDAPSNGPRVLLMQGSRACEIHTSIGRDGVYVLFPYVGVAFTPLLAMVAILECCDDIDERESPNE